MELFNLSTETLMSAVRIALICAVALIPFLLVVRLIMSLIDSTCQFCGRKVINFRQLPEEGQAAILSYFREYEQRTPDTKKIFVCPFCHTVFDDFSGEKAVRNLETRGGTTLCKKCRTPMFSKPGHAVRCMHCRTKHFWKTYEETGFRFLMPYFPPKSPAFNPNRYVKIALYRHYAYRLKTWPPAESRPPRKPTRTMSLWRS